MNTHTHTPHIHLSIGFNFVGTQFVHLSVKQRHSETYLWSCQAESHCATYEYSTSESCTRIYPLSSRYWIYHRPKCILPTKKKRIFFLRKTRSGLHSQKSIFIISFLSFSKRFWHIPSEVSRHLIITFRLKYENFVHVRDYLGSA